MVNITFGTYTPPKEEELDFNIKLKYVENDFVPLGIPNYKGEKENDTIDFDLIIEGKGINQWDLVIKHKNEIIYELFSATQELEEVIVTAKAKKGSKTNITQPKENKSERYWPAKTYKIKWDGFDKNDIYDSTIFTSEEGLIVTVIGKAEQKQKKYTLEKPLKFKYKEVDWVDVKIDNTNKKIDTTLRVNLTDGGAEGLDCSSTPISGSDYDEASERLGIKNPIKDSTITFCDWDKIPKSELIVGKEPKKSRSKTFKDLENIVFNGLRKHWSRSSTNQLAKGKFVIINNEIFEINIFPISSKIKALNSLPLVYNTNNSWMRSGNPGGKYKDGNLDDDLMNLIPDTGIIQRLSYNVGFIQHDWKDDIRNGWRFYTELGINKAYDAISDLEETGAHEIGHEIIQAYAGTVYSWQHKGSSYYLPQDTKPTKGNETLWDKMSHWDEMDSHGENYPNNDEEIDLMKYYNNEPNPKDTSRLVASEKDVLGLVWLTKLNIK